MSSSVFSLLSDIEFFQNCGQSVDCRWEQAIASDLQSAILGLGTGFAAFKIARTDDIEFWVRENVTGDAEQYLIRERDRIDGSVSKIVETKILTRLPTSLQNADGNTRRQVFAMFRWDLLHITIEHVLIALGIEKQFYLQLLDVYEAGRYPCGWHGQYPAGRLIVY